MLQVAPASYVIGHDAGRRSNTGACSAATTGRINLVKNAGAKLQPNGNAALR